jgi:tetratricopeptide (TPR) repeat protein
MNHFAHKDNISFIVGAGISMESPSTLPSAREFSKTLLQFMVPEEEVDKLINLPQLRYEMVVERVQKLDENLFFLDYLEQKTKFNLIHLFLAHCIKNNQKQMSVITTNFDYLIERALINILGEEEKRLIVPIITKSDYEKYQKRTDFQDRYPIFKIHGSKRNIITNDETTGSLVTTISSLGKNRESGETFALEAFKKPLINAILSNTSLFIMGYSGSDDFDITPLLNEFSELESITWVEHGSGTELNEMKIIEITKNFMEILDSNEYDNSVLSFLADLKKKHGYNIFYIKAHTLAFVQKVLWNLFHSDISIPLLNDLDDHNGITFEDFIRPYYNKIDFSANYTIAVKIYYDLSLYDDVVRVAEKGLTIYKEASVKKSNLLNHLGIISMVRGDLDKALDLCSKALETDELINYEQGIANKLNSIGMIFRRRSQFEKALSYYERSMKIYDKLGDRNGLMFIYNNIGSLQSEMKQPKLALEYFEKSLKISEEIGDLTRKATRLNNIAFIYSDEFGDFEKAISLIKEALKIEKEIGEYGAQALSYSNLATNYSKQGNKQESLKCYLEGLKIALDLNDVVRLTQIYPNIAEIYSEDGNNKEAIKYIKKGIECDKKIGDNLKLSNKFYRLGYFYDNEKDFIAAKEAYTQSIENAKLSENYKDMNEAAYNIAEILFDEEDYEGAIKHYSIGLECAKKLQIEKDIKVYYRNLGDTYNMSKQYENAIQNYKQVLKFYEAENNEEKIIELKESIGWCYQNLENYDIAVSLYEETLGIIERSSLSSVKSMIDNTLTVLTTICILGNIIEKGEKYAYLRLKIGEEANNHETLAYTYGNLAILNDKKGEYYNAIRFSYKAIEFAQKFNDQEFINTQEKNIQIFKKRIEE